MGLFRAIAVLIGLCIAAASAIAPGQAQERNLSVKSAEGGPRIALIIGNSAYKEQPLVNPANDAKLMGATLRSLGFETIERTDLDQKGMKLAVREFGERLDRAGKDAVGLFFYAGHGMQVNGRNYLIPVSANIKRESDVDIEGVAADTVMTTMEFAKSRLNFVILDACRNNPFARSFRSASQGLARMDAPRGTLIAYATSPGNVAADGAGANSPYTQALARVMKNPGLPVEQMFKQVRVSVMKDTNELQVPWESSSLTGDFFFGGAPQGGPAGAQVASPETVFWESVRASANPGDFQAYLNKYPAGEYKEIAEARIAALSMPQVNLVIDSLSEEFTTVIPVTLHAQPSTRGLPLAEIREGTQLKASGKVRGENWYRVAHAGGAGFVPGHLLEQDWYRKVAAQFEGEITNPVRSQPDRASTRIEYSGGQLAGRYTIFEPGAKTEGRLGDFQLTGKRRGVFRWRDAYGAGSLAVSFSEDLKSFTGTWAPDDQPDQGGKWSGKR